MRSSASLAVFATLALVRIDLGEARAADAGDADACKRAKEQLGANTRGLEPAECQFMLDQAEEERWQLWLDIATADELAGDLERSALSLNRFLTAADRRARPLSAQWVVMRDEARVKVARMDGELLKEKARVTISTIPDGAEATIVGGNVVTVPDRRPKTPLTAYFKPGDHTVRLRMPDTEQSREVSFTVVAGRTLELQVDMRTGQTKGDGVTERPGAPVLGQAPVIDGSMVEPPTARVEPGDKDGTDGPGEEPAPGEEPGAPGDEPGEPDPGEEPGEGPIDEDPEGPPVKASEPSLFRTLGTVGVTLGVAGVAIGTTYALIGAGLDDEAACKGTACDIDRPLRERVKRDAEVSWNRAAGMLVTGTLLLAGGIVAIVLDPDAGTPIDPDEEPAPKTTFTPWLSPAGVGLDGRITF